MSVKKNKQTLSSSEKKEMNFSMRLSFAIGVVILGLKLYAYTVTHSAAILSDTAESIIHMIAIGFAAYSMWYSLRPADESHLYGHEKITFFSAGFEGAMIIFSAIYIYIEAVKKFIHGSFVEDLGIGLFFVSIALIINLLLGFFLTRKGKKYQSIILEANGKHILTDSLTTTCVISALILVDLTGVFWLDPLIALIAATNILWTGWKLVAKSVKGLMDQTDPVLHANIVKTLLQETSQKNLSFHHLRHRMSGSTIFIDFHLLFSEEISLEKAHEIASEIEKTLQDSLEIHAEISTHLEPKADHDEIHKKHGLLI